VRGAALRVEERGNLSEGILGGRLAVGPLDLLVHLLTVDRDVGGGLDAHLHGVAIGADDLHDDPTVDDNAFPGFP